eukprot:3801087-Ditylum_brightwellii.AAC.1
MEKYVSFPLIFGMNCWEDHLVSSMTNGATMCWPMSFPSKNGCSTEGSKVQVPPLVSKLSP